MPSQPAWFHRLDEILSALRAMTSTHLDRVAVSREALIARLEWTAAAGVFQWEGNRRARVVEALDLARRQLAAQHVRIPAAADVCARLLGDPFRLTGTNGSSETRGGYYGNCLTLLL